jgi:hypothetical protein
MTPSLQKILECKRALRHDLASRPIAEKLRMLEEMRERTIAIRAGGAETLRSSTRAK